MSLKYTAIRAVFEAIWLSRLPSLVRAFSKSRGVIFTLHRILPDQPADFAPNSILQVRPDFLEYVIERLLHLDIDFVSLDEAFERLAARSARNFVVLTFDDAYRDNLKFALPILRRHDAPFTLYVPTAFVDGVGEVWWQALEDIIALNTGLTVPGAAEIDYLPAETLEQKRSTFDTLYWRMRKQPEPDRRAMLAELARLYKFDLSAHCRALIMDWPELRLVANDPLCTIGAHTVHHYELAKLDPVTARNEIAYSVDVLKAQFGTATRHFSYPLGGPLSAGQREYDMARELGLASAVTTRPGGLYPHHATDRHALPRVSLNGVFQSRRYVDVFATGGIFTALAKAGLA